VKLEDLGASVEGVHMDANQPYSRASALSNLEPLYAVVRDAKRPQSRLPSVSVLFAS
jgi:hypothetical protein